jgi:hypothetical protein
MPDRIDPLFNPQKGYATSGSFHKRQVLGLRFHPLEYSYVYFRLVIRSEKDISPLAMRSSGSRLW